MGEINWEGIAEDIVLLFYEHLGRRELTGMCISDFVLRDTIYKILISAAESLAPKEPDDAVE